MTTIEIYTRPGCGYCSHARHLLHSKGLPFVEYDVYQNPQQVHALRARTERRTYPQIFIEGLSIGGYEELLSLEAQNRLPGNNRPEPASTDL
ncbi:glutaredoxin [Gammaproteobacteria bacterium 54_18_T64]|nr:glutaredoxin [Gammaproteobacteria bacterium 54_18_T64]